MEEKHEQTYNLSDLKKLLPDYARIQFQRKKGQTGTSLEIEVKIRPALSEKEHDATVQKIIKMYGEDLLEVYTEETGYWFYVYLRMSATVPTTILP